MNKKVFFIVLTVMILCFSLSFLSFADIESNYPERDLEIIIPWGEGGFTDVMVRPLAAWLEDYFGVDVVVLNISGGGGVIGSKEIENAEPDGYTIGTTSFSTITAKYVSPNPPDMNNVETVAHIFDIPATLTVKADSQWDTIEDFVAYAKENPGEIMTSNSGFGASIHVNTIMFENAADVELTHVPYDSSGEPVIAVLGGHVDATFNFLPDVVDLVKAGELKILGIATTERHENYPEIPTFTERGYDYVIGNYTGILTPKGVEDEKIKILAEALEKATQDEQLREFMLSNEFSPVYYGPEKFRDFLKGTEEDLDYIVEVLGIELVDD